MSTKRDPLTRRRETVNIARKVGAGVTTHLVEDSPLIDSDAASCGPNSGSSSPEPHDEEAIFTLLFQQCDSEGTGEVGIEQLISYIRKVRLGQQHSDKEEVYDSQDDLPTMQYNLHLLRAMLECNSTAEGKVDQPTYSHIIRMWIKDVRDRTKKTAAPEPKEHMSRRRRHRESSETSGHSFSHNERDRIDLINSIADLKLGNKRLQEMNRALQVQMEGSEEHLRELQTENQQLKQDIKDFQANLNRLEQVEGENTVLAALVDEGKRQCQQLASSIDKQEKEVANLQEDLRSARVQLSATELERKTLNEENSTLKQLLLQKEEELSHQEATCTHCQMEAQLQLESQRFKELSQTLEIKQIRNELKSENSDFQTQLQLGLVRKPAMSRASSPPHPTQVTETAEYAPKTLVVVITLTIVAAGVAVAILLGFTNYHKACHEIFTDDVIELAEIISSHGSAKEWCTYLRISESTCNRLDYSHRHQNEIVLDVAKAILNEKFNPCWEDIVCVLCKSLKKNKAALKLSEKHSVNYSSQCG